MSDSTPPSDSASVNSRVALGDRDGPVGGRAFGPATGGRHERDHPAPPRVVDRGDVGAAAKEGGDRRGVRPVPLHAQVERPQPAQHEEAVERTGDGAHRVLEEAQPLGDGLVRGDGHAQDRVRVAGEVLRRGVEDDVGAVLQRPLERRGREGVVDDDQRPPAALGRAPGHDRDRRRDVDDLEVRVRRRLEPDEAGPLGQRLPQDVRPGREVDVARVHAGPATDPLEVPERAAVDVVADDDLVARSCQLGDRRRDRRPRGERDPVRPALERSDRPLQAFARRVLRARVLVPAARLADAVLGVRAGLVDRRADRAGQLVGFGAGMDGQCVERGRSRIGVSGVTSRP